MAEKEKREKEEVYEKAKGTNFSKILLVLGGVILIGIAIWGSFFLFQKKKEISQPVVTTTSTFISYDSKSEINVTNATGASSLSEIIKNYKLGSKTIENLSLIRQVNGASETLTSKDFLSLIQTSIPGALIRSLTDEYFLGRYLNPNVVDANDKSAIFLILETTDYSQAYASMLLWEKTMPRDLFSLFNISESSNLFSLKPWSDIIVDNKDARVLYGESGEGILYYTFVNKNNFVITNNIDALKEVINRLLIKNQKTL